MPTQEWLFFQGLTFFQGWQFALLQRKTYTGQGWCHNYLARSLFGTWQPIKHRTNCEIRVILYSSFLPIAMIQSSMIYWYKVHISIHRKNQNLLVFHCTMRFLLLRSVNGKFCQNVYLALHFHFLICSVFPGIPLVKTTKISKIHNCIFQIQRDWLLWKVW